MNKDIIKKELHRQKAMLKKTQKDFEKYDNIDDMRSMENIEYAIEVLEDLLKENK